MASTNRFNVAGVRSGNVNFHGSLKKKKYFNTLIVLLFSLLPTQAFSQEPSNGLTELFGALKQLQNAIEKGRTDQSTDMPSKDLNLGKSSGAVSATEEVTDRLAQIISLIHLVQCTNRLYRHSEQI